MRSAQATAFRPPRYKLPHMPIVDMAGRACRRWCGCQSPGKYGGRGDQHVNDNRVHGHDPPRPGVIPVLKVLGHRVDAGTQETRQEEESNDDDGHRAAELIVGHGESGAARALARHADELFRGNVRRHDGQADERPCQSAPGKEVVLTCLFPAAFEHADADDQQQETGKHGNVKKTEYHSTSFGGSLEYSLFHQPGMRKHTPWREISAV